MKQLIEKFESMGFVLEINESALTAKALKIKSKAFIQKPQFFIKFRDLQRMEEFLLYWIKVREERAEEVRKNKQLAKEAMELASQAFKIGDIYYDSWGWEQTNIDFYQILEVKAKSVVVKRISERYCESEGLSSMAARVAPVPNNFIGEQEVKRVKVFAKEGQKPEYYIKSKHGWISKYDRGEQGVYSSWYA